jgi:hypothetical protein
MDKNITQKKLQQRSLLPKYPEKTLRLIKEYIKPIRHEPGKSVNSFKIGKKVFLLDKKHCNYIYRKILSKHHYKDLIKNLVKKDKYYGLQPNILSMLDNLKNQDLSEDLKILLNAFKNDNKSLSWIINDTVSELLLESINSTFSTNTKKKPVAFTASYSNLALNLGTIILDWFFTCDEKASGKIFPVGLDVTASLRQFNGDCDAFEKHIEELYCNFLLDITKFPSKRIFNIVKNCNIFIYMNNKRFTKYMRYFVIKDKDIITKEATKFTLKLGSFFIDSLLSSGILEEIRGRTTYVTIAADYKDSLLLSSVNIKPVLYSTQTSKVSFQLKRKKFKFAVSIARANYMKLAKAFKYEVPLTTRKIVSHTSPYCINGRFLNLYVDYLKEIDGFQFSVNTLIKPFTKEAQHVVNYILIHYDFDIYELKQTSGDDAFIQDLLDFIKDGENLFDKTSFIKLNNDYKFYRKCYEQHCNYHGIHS